jgi:hypothetical protein
LVNKIKNRELVRIPRNCALMAWTEFETTCH